jgi:hypothetical protein
MTTDASRSLFSGGRHDRLHAQEGPTVTTSHRPTILTATLLAVLLSTGQIAPAAEPARASGLVLPGGDGSIVIADIDGRTVVRWTDRTKVALKANWRQLANVGGDVIHYGIHSSGQRLVLMRLTEGSLFLATFARGQTLTDAAGKPRKVTGLFGALSDDEGETWPIRRPITDGKGPRRVDGGGNTGVFTMGPDSAEPRGYLAARQTPDGVIHLISSKQHYAFNVAWLKARMPGTSPADGSK